MNAFYLLAYNNNNLTNLGSKRKKILQILNNQFTQLRCIWIMDSDKRNFFAWCEKLNY